MATIAVVPGLTVRRYVLPAARALEEAGHHVYVLPAPASPGSPVDLDQYAAHEAGRLARLAPDLLIGLSAGCQVCGLVAGRHWPGPGPPDLMLVSPTVDPARRSWRACVAGMTATLRTRDRKLRDPGLNRSHLPEWRAAGLRRLVLGTRSTMRHHLECTLPLVRSRVHIVHAEFDVLVSHDYAARLARPGCRLTVVPDATHSWPHGDPDRFVSYVGRLLADREEKPR